MKKYLKNNKILGIFGLALIMLFSCAGEENSTYVYSPPVSVKIIPSNLTFEITLVGADIENPNGDGAGVLKCVAIATDANEYEFRFGNGDIVTNTTGSVEYTYIETGTKTYTIDVYAFSETGDSISISQQVEIFVAPQSFDDLVWSDEFNDGESVSLDNWKFETVAPNNGSWWNDELQHYTNRTDNAFVSDGTLKIVAKKEEYTAQGVTHSYTSARLNSIFTFTYGRVDVRAKLPFGEGTWPAIWMLGSNTETVGWPECGEIDILEHWGHVPGEIASATHKPSCYGACEDARVGATMVNDYSTAFHVYSLEWTNEELRFLIDNEVKYTYNPSIKNDETWPFKNDQFLILNVAMGGSWFSVDPNFVSSSMEIDYVRVYN